MEALTLQQIAKYAGGELGPGDPSRLVNAISTDSRTLLPGELFLALRGDHFDGHNHIQSAIAAGAVGAIVDTEFASTDIGPDFALITVKNTLAAYQRIASFYRRSLPMKVVAITGSNGKTSTKDLTAAVLSRRFRVLKTEGNLNNHIGVPRMLLRADGSHEVAVLEMGMNHPGEIAPLAAMAAPDIAIITNIGCAHLEFMGSRGAIAKEKGTLAEAVEANGAVILNAADEFSPSITQRTHARVISVGEGSGTLHAEALTQDLHGSRFTVVAGEERIAATLPVPGRHMVTNALLAVATGLELGLTLSDCVTALSQVNLTKGRLELKKLHGRTFLDDSYNANPDSMTVAIETLAAIPTQGRRIAILGKMGELGDAAGQGYEHVGEVAAGNVLDYVITVGGEAEAIALAARNAGVSNTLSLSNTDDAARWLSEESRPDDLILIKGSRSAAMERILTQFAQIVSPSDTLAHANFAMTHVVP